MSTLSFIQVLRSYFLFTTVGFIFIRFCDKSKQKICRVLSDEQCDDMCAMNNLFSTAHAISCQVYPSEYAYRNSSRSVIRAESTSANCMNYPAASLQIGIQPEYYIHCDGTQLNLADSTFGQEQYQSSDYYWWSTGSDAQLLFKFPTSVSLTAITLHYYSESVRGLRRLRFYAVPEDFNVWNAPTTQSHMQMLLQYHQMESQQVAGKSASMSTSAQREC